MEEITYRDPKVIALMIASVRRRFLIRRKSLSSGQR